MNHLFTEPTWVRDVRREHPGLVLECSIEGMSTHHSLLLSQNLFYTAISSLITFEQAACAALAFVTGRKGGQQNDMWRRIDWNPPIGSTYSNKLLAALETSSESIYHRGARARATGEPTGTSSAKIRGIDSRSFFVLSIATLVLIVLGCRSFLFSRYEMSNRFHHQRATGTSSVSIAVNCDYGWNIIRYV